MDVCMDGWIDGCVCMYGRMEGWMDVCTDVCVCVDGWMYVYMYSVRAGICQISYASPICAFSSSYLCVCSSKIIQV